MNVGRTVNLDPLSALDCELLAGRTGLDTSPYPSKQNMPGAYRCSGNTCRRDKRLNEHRHMICIGFVPAMPHHRDQVPFRDIQTLPEPGPCTGPCSKHLANIDSSNPHDHLGGRY